MRNGYGLPPVYSQEQEMQRGIGMGMGMGFNEGYRLPNPNEGIAAAFSQNQGFSTRREFGIMPNHIGMLSSSNMVKSDPGFSSELANVNQFDFSNHSTSMKVIPTCSFYVIVTVLRSKSCVVNRNLVFVVSGHK